MRILELEKSGGGSSWVTLYGDTPEAQEADRQMHLARNRVEAVDECMKLGKQLTETQKEEAPLEQLWQLAKGAIAELPAEPIEEAEAEAKP